MKNSIFTLVILFSGFVSAQSVRNVPSQYSTIQAALNAAQSGDTVLVQPGTYKENIFWPNVNGIKLIAAQNNGNTIIDGNMVSSCITIISDGSIDSNTLISNFWITNGGNVDNGGGLAISMAGPKIKGCRISKNKANIYGGAIYVNGVGLIIDSCVISENEANFGGGICSFKSGSTVTINLSSLTVNKAFDSGGGIFLLAGADVLLVNSRIDFNKAFYRGGGIFKNASSLKILKSSISFNVANDLYGGVSLGSNSCTYNYVKFIGNEARSWAMGDFQGDTLIGCVIANNSVKDSLYIPSAVMFLYGTYVEKCNISNNVSPSGQIILIENPSQTTFKNVQFSNNGSSRKGIPLIRSMSSPLVNVMNSNFMMNGRGIFNADNSVLISAANNWWGDSSGPYHPSQNPTGTGDSVNMFVNVTPWLTSPDTVAPPIPAQNVSITTSGKDFISLAWDSSIIGDLKGYKVFYKTDSSGYPYDNSIDVGNVTNYKISGLQTGKKYFIAVVVYDLGGNESWYSNEVSAIPIAPVLSAESLLSFSDTKIQDSTIQTVNLISSNASPVTISSISVAMPAFHHSISLPAVITGGDTLKLPVTFKPVVFGSYSDTLTVVSDGGTKKIVLTGNSPHPTITANLTSINFDAVARNTTKHITLVLTNSSINALSIDSVFTHEPLLQINKPKFTVPTMDSLTITYSPVSFGDFFDTLYLKNNSVEGLVKLPVYGGCPSPQIDIWGGNGLVFNPTKIGDSSVLNIALKNSSPSAGEISKMTIGSYFSIPLDTVKFVPGNDSVIFPIKYKPLGFGSHSTNLIVDTEGRKIGLEIEGSSPFPQLLLNASFGNLGQVGVYVHKKDSAWIKNSSLNDLMIDSVSMTSGYLSTSLSKKLVKQNDSALFVVTFSSPLFGDFKDTLSIANNSAANVRKIPIQATVPYPVISIVPSKIDFGIAMRDSIKERTFTIKNSSISNLEIDSLLTGTPHFDVVKVLANSIITQKDSAFISIRFSPDSIRVYNDTLFIFNTSKNNPAKIPLVGNGVLTGIKPELSGIPDNYSLAQNYPNPFNPSTTIRYGLPSNSRVSLKIYNILGQQLAELISAEHSAGWYETVWNANVSSGLYFYRIDAVSISDTKHQFTQLKKMILIK